MRNCLTVLALLLMLAPASGNAFVCNVSTTPLSFGSYDVFSPVPNYSTGTVSVNCNNPDQKPMPVNIAINSGGSGSFNPRQLRARIGTDRLNYFLFTDPSRTVIWGDGTGGTSAVVNSVSKSAPWNATLYATLPQRQNVSAGSYSDSVVVTVTW